MSWQSPAFLTDLTRRIHTHYLPQKQILVLTLEWQVILIGGGCLSAPHSFPVVPFLSFLHLLVEWAQFSMAKKTFFFKIKNIPSHIQCLIKSTEDTSNTNPCGNPVMKDFQPVLSCKIHIFSCKMQLWQTFHDTEPILWFVISGVCNKNSMKF